MGTIVGDHDVCRTYLIRTSIVTQLVEAVQSLPLSPADQVRLI